MRKIDNFFKKLFSLRSWYHSWVTGCCFCTVASYYHRKYPSKHFLFLMIGNSAQTFSITGKFSQGAFRSFNQRERAATLQIEVEHQRSPSIHTANFGQFCVIKATLLSKFSREGLRWHPNVNTGWKPVCSTTTHADYKQLL